MSRRVAFLVTSEVESVGLEEAGVEVLENGGIVVDDLMKTSKAGVYAAALRLGAIGYDAVRHLVLCRIERRPPRLDLDVYPYLPRARVATTAAATYMSLLGGAGS